MASLDSPSASCCCYCCVVVVVERRERGVVEGTGVSFVPTFMSHEAGGGACDGWTAGGLGVRSCLSMLYSRYEGSDKRILSLLLLPLQQRRKLVHTSYK